MAFAYWMAHAPSSLYPALNGGDAAILYCFIFLYLAVAGPGAFSVDRATSLGECTEAALMHLGIKVNPSLPGRY